MLGIHESGIWMPIIKCLLIACRQIFVCIPHRDTKRVWGGQVSGDNMQLLPLNRNRNQRPLSQRSSENFILVSSLSADASKLIS